jgi:hypothetical protein
MSYVLATGQLSVAEPMELLHHLLLGSRRSGPNAKAVASSNVGPKYISSICSETSPSRYQLQLTFYGFD